TAWVPEVPHGSGWRWHWLRTEQETDIPCRRESLRDLHEPFRIEVACGHCYVHWCAQCFCEESQTHIEGSSKGVAVAIVDEFRLAQARLLSAEKCDSVRSSRAW